MQIRDLMVFTGLAKKKEDPSLALQQNYKTNPPSYGEKIIELTWTAPSKVQKDIQQKTAKTIITIIIAISILLALMQDFMVIVVISSVGFLYYMLMKSPTRQVEHEVSTHGLWYAKEHFYYWHELKQFFFKKDDEHVILCVDTVEPLPGRLFLNINPQDQEKLKEIFSKRVVYLEEEPKIFLDNIYNSLISKINLTGK